jgi:hypothetical protein
MNGNRWYAYYNITSMMGLLNSDSEIVIGYNSAINDD